MSATAGGAPSRLALKQTPLDTWSTREHLALASAVLRSGDQNWMSVSRAMRGFADPGRPPDWFAQKNCAQQYARLLELVDTPRRKRERGEPNDTPGESIVRKLTQDRVDELRRQVAEARASYTALKTQIRHLRSGQLDAKLDEIQREIQVEKEAVTQEQERRRQWLADREAQKLAVQQALRAQVTKAPPPKRRKLMTDRRESSPSEAGSVLSELDLVDSPASEAPAAEASGDEASRDASEQRPAPASPLLTSLLRSPSGGRPTPPAAAPAAPAEAGAPPAGSPTLSRLLELPPGAAGQAMQAKVNLFPDQKSGQNGELAATAAAAVTAADAQEKLEPEVKEEPAAQPPSPPPESEQPAQPAVAAEMEVESEPSAEEAVNVKEEPTEPVDELATELADPEPNAPSAASIAAASNSAENTATAETSASATANTATSTTMNTAVTTTASTTTAIAVGTAATAKASTTAVVLANVTADTTADTAADTTADKPNAEVAVTDNPAGAVAETAPVTTPAPPVATASKPAPGDSKQKPAVDVESKVDTKSEPSEDKLKSLPESKPNPAAEPAPNEKAAVANVAAASGGVDDVPTASAGLAAAEVKQEPADEAEGEPAAPPTKEAAPSEDPEPPLPPPPPVKEERDGSDAESAASVGPAIRARSASARSEPASHESVPNSPASGVLSGDDEERRDYKLWKKSILLLWREFAAHRHASMFARPITNDQASNYRAIVRAPMDLAQMKRNVESGAVTTTSQFLRDLMLMFCNAMMFNSSDHEVYRFAREMQAECVQKLRLLQSDQQGAGGSKRRETRESSRDDLKRKRSGDERPTPTRKRR